MKTRISATRSLKNGEPVLSFYQEVTAAKYAQVHGRVVDVSLYPVRKKESRRSQQRAHNRQ